MTPPTYLPSLTVEQMRELIAALVNRPSELREVISDIADLTGMVRELRQQMRDLERTVQQRLGREAYDQFVADNPIFGPARPGHVDDA